MSLVLPPLALVLGLIGFLVVETVSLGHVIDEISLVYVSVGFD